ncbi:MAG: alanine:cation symporter family protein, partial [Muribaculaceae bacterium]|nr:alanine:cation symporter family protein [Muribaculaceae bacterium]
IMHGSSSNTSPVREGLVAMLGPAVDSGLVCTLTALAIMLVIPVDVLSAYGAEGVKGLELATHAFSIAIPGGEYMLIVIVACFALSSMFSYSYYGTSCAAYLFGAQKSKWYAYAFIATIAIFAVVPLGAAVALCDIFYALMAIPTMITVIALSGRVRSVAKSYFSSIKE